MKIIENIIIDHISRPKDDAFTIYGTDEETLISKGIFDFRKIPVNTQDEVISGVNGAKVSLSGVVIIGGIKVILAGNGDYPISDFKNGEWYLENCAILHSGRRCPEAQDGVKVFMKNCWIHNWGETFDVRSFGSWAHRGGLIVAEDCVFTQNKNISIKNAIIDLANHIGQRVNDAGVLSLLECKTYLPGRYRGLTSNTGGRVYATRIYKNKKFINIENCNEYITKDKAKEIIKSIQNACLDTTEKLGCSLSEYFEKNC